jgi:hypothetical protein
MKKIEKLTNDGNKHGNRDEFPDVADLFFFGLTNVNVGGKILLSVGRKHTHFFFGLSMIACDLVEIKLQKT